VRQPEKIWKVLRKKMIDGHKVWDAFPFAGYDPELDLLEIRLHELEDVVDRHVLVEATRTHSGKPKPLNFVVNRKRFERFVPKIEYVVVDTFPEADMTKLGESWKYERHQRDAITRGLSAAKDGDIVISSDLDEIPKASALRSYRPSQGMVGFDLSLHTYWFNMVNRETEYAWCKVLPFEMARKMTHCQIRYTFGHPIVKNGGWHFSYMGGPDQVVEKIESFAHQEYSIPRCKDKAAILRRMMEGVDPHERSIRYHLEGMEQGVYPDYILKNLEKFKRFINYGPSTNPVTGLRGHIGISGYKPPAADTPAGEKSVDDWNRSVWGGTGSVRSMPLDPPGAPAPAPAGEKSVDWNRSVWGSYAWPEDGDEWKEFAAFSGVSYESWKDSLARTFLYPYLVPARSVLEIGAGHGRWSKEIVKRLGANATLDLVDVTPSCIQFLRGLFQNDPHIQAYANDGRSLPMVASASKDFVFSFDAFVHIEEPEFRSYAKELRRVMAPKGMGVIHHPGNPNAEQKAKGCRSSLTAQAVRRILTEQNFMVLRQTDAWEGGNVKAAGDQISVFVKP
jgi:beta-1,4-mannosyl-glycoprotein beta-1,4-N-acetylglucosaminyltransferase